MIFRGMAKRGCFYLRYLTTARCVAARCNPAEYHPKCNMPQNAMQKAVFCSAKHGLSPSDLPSIANTFV